MKTNQNMTRQMGNFNVIQRTKDGMFNGGNLLYQWNKSINNKRRRMIEFLESSKTKEFINEMQKELVDEKIDNPVNQIVIIKKGKTSKSGTKNPDDVWMHPYLFIDFAMWINPKFKLTVIKFVYDKMIEYRVDAGTEYKELAKSVSSLVNKDFMRSAMPKISKAINYIIFNDHRTGIRNEFGNEDKQRELYELEKKISELINEGFITTYNQLLEYLRKQWQNTHNPICA